MAAITKIDDDKTWRERIAAGDVVVNYGAQLVYRSQDYATYNLSSYSGSAYSLDSHATLSSATSGLHLPPTSTPSSSSPALWFKLGWKALTLDSKATCLQASWAMPVPCDWENHNQ